MIQQQYILIMYNIIKCQNNNFNCFLFWIKIYIYKSITIVIDITISKGVSRQISAHIQTNLWLHQATQYLLSNRNHTLYRHWCDQYPLHGSKRYCTYCIVLLYAIQYCTYIRTFLVWTHLNLYNIFIHVTIKTKYQSKLNFNSKNYLYQKAFVKRIFTS